MNRIYPVCQSTPNWAFQGPQNWCPKPSYGAPPFSVCRPRETTQQFPISWSPQNRPPTMVHGIPFHLMTPGRHVRCPRPAPWWPQRAIFWRRVFANFLKTKIATLYCTYSSAKSKWLFEAWITVFSAIFWFHYILQNKFSELQETEIQKYSQK